MGRQSVADLPSAQPMNLAAPPHESIIAVMGAGRRGQHEAESEPRF